MRCPRCNTEIPYSSVVLAGTERRLVWCNACGTALKRKTSLLTCLHLVVSLAVAWAFHSVTLLVVLVPFDLAVDRLTVELVPLELGSCPDPDDSGQVR